MTHATIVHTRTTRIPRFDPFLSLIEKNFVSITRQQRVMDVERWWIVNKNGESMWIKGKINVDDNLTILKANHYFISRNGQRHV